MANPSKAQLAIQTFDHKISFQKHSYNLGSSEADHVDDKYIAYHFNDGSTAMTKGRGPNWQVWVI